MLLVDFTKDIGYIYSRDSDGNINLEYEIYYCPNALFAIATRDEHSLFSFAADLEHLKNLLGLSKQFKGKNLFKGFYFHFTYYPAYDSEPRIRKVFNEVAKLFFSKVSTNYFGFTVVNREDKE